MPNVLNVYIYLTNICKTATSTQLKTKPPVNHRQREYGFHVVVKKKTRYACIGRRRRLLHETFHNLDLDFSLKRDNTAVLNCLKSILNISKDELNIYETYCEVWAVFISVIFRRVITRMTVNLKQKEDAKLFSFVLNALMETRWSLLK
jgi:hypothetical protein